MWKTHLLLRAPSYAVASLDLDPEGDGMGCCDFISAPGEDSSGSVGRFIPSSYFCREVPRERAAPKTPLDHTGPRSHCQHLATYCVQLV